LAPSRRTDRSVPSASGFRRRAPAVVPVFPCKIREGFHPQRRSKSAVKNNLANKHMKTTTSLLLAGAVALGFTLGTTVKADEPLPSPKAAALRHDLRKAPSADTSPNLVSHNFLGAASRLEFSRAKVVPSGTAAANLVSGSYLGAGAKNPYPPTRSFEIAPL